MESPLEESIPDEVDEPVTRPNKFTNSIHFDDSILESIRPIVISKNAHPSSTIETDIVTMTSQTGGALLRGKVVKRKN